MHRLVSDILQDVEGKFDSLDCRGTVEQEIGLLQRHDTLRVHMTLLGQTSTRHQNLLTECQPHKKPIDNGR